MIQHDPRLSYPMFRFASKATPRNPHRSHWNGAISPEKLGVQIRSWMGLDRLTWERCRFMTCPRWFFSKLLSETCWETRLSWWDLRKSVIFDVYDLWCLMPDYFFQSFSQTLKTWSTLDWRIALPDHTTCAVLDFCTRMASAASVFVLFEAGYFRPKSR